MALVLLALSLHHLGEELDAAVEVLDEDADGPDLATEVADFTAHPAHLAAEVAHLAAQTLEISDLTAQPAHLAAEIANLATDAAELNAKLVANASKPRVELCAQPRLHLGEVRDQFWIHGPTFVGWQAAVKCG